jgi:hypothetical protein
MKIQEHGSFRLAGLSGEAEESKGGWVEMENDKPGFIIQLWRCVCAQTLKDTIKQANQLFKTGHLGPEQSRCMVAIEIIDNLVCRFHCKSVFLVWVTAPTHRRSARLSHFVLFPLALTTDSEFSQSQHCPIFVRNYIFFEKAHSISQTIRRRNHSWTASVYSVLWRPLKSV